MISKHFIVSGRVQGVWFRASTQKQAICLGLHGWIRNLADGRVELVAGGDLESLEQMQAWLWEGPPLAQVDQVVSEDIADDWTDSSEGDLPEPFEIR